MPINIFPELRILAVSYIENQPSLQMLGPGSENGLRSGNWAIDHDIPIAAYCSCILGVYCYVKNYPINWWLKTANIYYLPVTGGQGSGSNLGGSPGSLCQMMFHLRYWPEIRKLRGSTGTSWATSNFTHMVGGSPLFLTGYSQHHFAARPPLVWALHAFEGRGSCFSLARGISLAARTFFCLFFYWVTGSTSKIIQQDSISGHRIPVLLTCFLTLHRQMAGLEFTLVCDFVIVTITNLKNSLVTAIGDVIPWISWLI